MQILWSKAAIAAAGTTVAVPRTSVEAERAEIIPDSWMHSVLAAPEGDTTPAFLCRGRAAEDGWTIHVRVGQYGSSPGVNVKMPRPTDVPENDSFEE